MRKRGFKASSFINNKYLQWSSWYISSFIRYENEEMPNCVKFSHDSSSFSFLLGKFISLSQGCICPETVAVEGKSGLGKLVSTNSVSAVASCSCTRTVKIWICTAACVNTWTCWCGFVHFFLLVYTIWYCKHGGRKVNAFGNLLIQPTVGV